jgi:membrane protein
MQHVMPADNESGRDVSRISPEEIEEYGRGAKSPSEVPAKGWKDILLRLYANIGEDRILALAAGVTYYSLLAIFPALAALVAICGLFSDPTGIAKHLDEISGVAPTGAIDVAREQLTRVSLKGS